MTLDEIVTFCRKNNILVWQGRATDVGEVVQLHFGPVVPATEFDKDDVKDLDNKPKTEKRRGKDGRTAAEQRELYNKVIDAEE